MKFLWVATLPTNWCSSFGYWFMFTEFLAALSESDLAAVMWSLADYDITPDEDYPEYYVPIPISLCSDILESRFVTLQDIEEYLELRKQTRLEANLWNEIMLHSSDPLVGF
jgi:hypothetical protein